MIPFLVYFYSKADPSFSSAADPSTQTPRKISYSVDILPIQRSLTYFILIIYSARLQFQFAIILLLALYTEKEIGCKRKAHSLPDLFKDFLLS